MQINTDGLHPRVVELLTDVASSTKLGHVKGGSNVLIAGNGTLSVNEATLNQKGITKLNNTLTSTSVDEAATANMVKTVNDSLSTHVNNADIHFSLVERNKLAAIEPEANNYLHPESHPATMITGLAKVATSGLYADLTGLPTLGNAVGNVPVIGSDGKLDGSIMPSIAITDVYPVSSEAQMLALDAQNGDIAIRSDIDANFVLQKTPATTLSNWIRLRVPIDSVTSVAGKTGVVVLSKGDVGLSNVDNVQQASKTDFDNHKTDTTLHITSAERAAWNGKASTALASATANGLMAKEDKSKLDSIAANANNYSLPFATSSVLGGVKTGTNITNSSGTISVPNASDTVAGVVKIVQVAGSTAADAAASAALVTSINTALSNHTSDTTAHITSTERTTWNAKASTSVVTTAANGLMTKEDKSKLDNIDVNANNYSLPASTSVTLGGVKTGTNITNSSGTISIADASTTVKGVVQLVDSTASTSTTLAATGNSVKTVNDALTSHKNDTTVHITAAERTAWNGKASTTAATTSANGLMTAADKTKLDGIAASANNYSLPAATASVLGGVKSGTNITNSSGTLSVADASTTVKGVVQLVDSVSSTSTVLAATGNAVKTVNDNLSTFIAKRDNPHQVTKSQVGLSSVADYPVATTAQATAGTATDAYMTPALVMAAITSTELAKTIPAGTDLNTLIKPGRYAYVSGTIPTNSPFSRAYYLVVINNSDTGQYPLQIAHKIYTDEIYYRTKIDATAGGAWTPWEMFSKESTKNQFASNITIGGMTIQWNAANGSLDFVAN